MTPWLGVPEPVERVVRDPRFDRLVPAGASITPHADGAIWAEGPVYLPADDAVDLERRPGQRRAPMVDTASGARDLYRPSDFANGHTLDRDGTVLACEHGPRRVARYETDGSRTTVVDRYEGHRLNSPNDIVVASDGAIWFTDPPYGILDDTEGYRADSELGGCFVFRLDRDTGELAVVTDAIVHPNGLAFSPDETTCTCRTPRSRGSRAATTTSSRSTSSTDGPSPPHASSRSSSPACRTGSGSTSRATSGPRPATASTSWRPTPGAGPDRAARGGQQLHVRRPGRPAPVHHRDLDPVVDRRRHPRRGHALGRTPARRSRDRRGRPASGGRATRRDARRAPDRTGPGWPPPAGRRSSRSRSRPSRPARRAASGRSTGANRGRPGARSGSARR